MRMRPSAHHDHQRTKGWMRGIRDARQTTTTTTMPKLFLSLSLADSLGHLFRSLTRSLMHSHKSGAADDEEEDREQSNGL